MMSGLKSSSVSFQNLGCVCLVFSATLSCVPREEAPERQGVGGAGGRRGVTQERSQGQQGGAVHVPSTPRTAGSQSEGSFEACLEGADM